MTAFHQVSISESTITQVGPEAELLRLRDELIGLRAQHDEQCLALTEENKRLAETIEAMRRTWTWRIGRIFVGPFSYARVGLNFRRRKKRA